MKTRPVTVHHGEKRRPCVFCEGNVTDVLAWLDRQRTGRVFGLCDAHLSQLYELGIVKLNGTH